MEPDDKTSTFDDDAPSKQHMDSDGMEKEDAVLDRARGCFIGQLVGDALGSQVEFMTPAAIRERYPDGVMEMTGGGPWKTIPGQPTANSEMAIALARTLIKKHRYDAKAARRAYKSWLNSNPFDLGRTVSSSLSGIPRLESQANGALMRISPLGIFGVWHTTEEVAAWAMADAAITHPHVVCQQVNALFAEALAQIIHFRLSAKEADIFISASIIHPPFNFIGRPFEQVIRDAVLSYRELKDYVPESGWVIVSLYNALQQLRQAKSFEEGVVNTVMRGCDANTSGAICGALLGAVYGLKAIPRKWVETVLNCRPALWKLWLNHPRPRRYWPVDSLRLADKLLHG